MDRQRNVWFKQLLAFRAWETKVFPLLAVASGLIFLLGVISYFGQTSTVSHTVTSAASEGSRIQAIKDLADQGKSTYEYKTGQMPPPMASQ